MQKLLLPLFVMLSILEVIAEAQSWEVLILFVKPLLLTVLSLWFYLSVKPRHSTFSRLILAGLIFSIGGDTLLMFVENGPANEQFFLFGLGSFLIAQLCYLVGFANYSKGKKGTLERSPLLILPFLLFLICIVWFLWPGIPGMMQIPVAVYSLAIVGMAIAAFNLQGLIAPSVFVALMAGVLLFVLSDSLIAINKFRTDVVRIPYVRVWIMATYLAAQYLIATSSYRLNVFIVGRQVAPQQQRGSYTGEQ